ncbi:hypothetical protein GOBAR_DD07801 [Gossypium barbadense]|nr:hypothetical protein GOBAR_DD07801 [Gossypium barbadense]
MTSELFWSASVRERNNSEITDEKGKFELEERPKVALQRSKLLNSEKKPFKSTTMEKEELEVEGQDEKYKFSKYDQVVQGFEGYEDREHPSCSWYGIIDSIDFVVNEEGGPELLDQKV